MSAIAKEEIERIIDEEGGVPRGAFLHIAERVAGRKAIRWYAAGEER